MELNDIQDIIKKHSKEIEEKVIPIVTVKVMDAFHEGFKCGMDIGCTVIRDTTMEWLSFQINEGNIETRDMEKFIERLLDKFRHLDFDEREHAFLLAIGKHLHIRFEDWEKEIKRLKGALYSQSKEYEAKLKEWQENHKQLTTAYNDLHYQYKQLKKEEKK